MKTQCRLQEDFRGKVLGQAHKCVHPATNSCHTMLHNGGSKLFSRICECSGSGCNPQPEEKTMPYAGHTICICAEGAEGKFAQPLMGRGARLVVWGGGVWDPSLPLHGAAGGRNTKQEEEG